MSSQKKQKEAPLEDLHFNPIIEPMAYKKKVSWAFQKKKTTKRKSTRRTSRRSTGGLRNTFNSAANQAARKVIFATKGLAGVVAYNKDLLNSFRTAALERKVTTLMRRLAAGAPPVVFNDAKIVSDLKDEARKLNL